MELGIYCSDLHLLHVFISMPRTIDHAQIMFCCLNPTFMANDVSFILIRHIFE